MTAGAEVLLFFSLGLSFHCNLPEAPLGAIPLVPSVSTEGITICFSATRLCIATWALKVLYISLGNKKCLHTHRWQIFQSHCNKNCPSHSLEIAKEYKGEVVWINTDSAMTGSYKQREQVHAHSKLCRKQSTKGSFPRKYLAVNFSLSTTRFE